MLKIMGRFIFLSYPEVKLTVSKTAFDALIRKNSKIFKIYKEPSESTEKKYFYRYYLDYIYGNITIRSIYPDYYHKLFFHHTAPTLQSNMISHFLLNIALFIKFIKEDEVYRAAPEKVSDFTITKCEYSENYCNEMKSKKILGLYYTQPYKGLPPKHREQIIVFTYIYENFKPGYYSIESSKLRIPNFIFNPSENYYKIYLPFKFQACQF